MKILIIDNNPAFLNVFAKLLEVKGFDVTAETVFKAGLKRLESKSYPIVFVDFPLDSFTEKQILTSLTKSHVFKNSNVFLFSSVDLSAVDLDEWKKKGLYSYLKKPVKRSTIIKALDDVRAKVNDTSQASSKTEHEDEEEPEAAPQTEPEAAPQTEPEDEEATPEQLEKLNQLQKQIQELESISHQHSLSKLDSQSEKSIHVEPESITNDLAFKNIIDNLKSLQSKFESAEQSIAKSFIKTDVEENELVKKKLKETLFKLSRLKSTIQSLAEIGDSELKSGPPGTKKSKATKKSGPPGTKKPSKLRKH